MPERPAMRLWSCWRVTPSALAAATIVTPRASISSPIISPGWGGFFIGMVGPPSMVIDKIDIRHVAVFEAENDPPVGAHGDRPKPLQVALEGVQPVGLNIEAGQGGCRVEQGQNLLDLAHMLGIDAPRIVLFEKLLQAFVSKAPYHRPSAASSLLASVKRFFTTFNQYFTGIAVRLSAPRASVPSGLTPPRRALGPAIRSAWPQRHSFPGRRHPTVRHATNAPPPPSCVGPNSASVLHRRPRGRLRQLWGSAPAPPRASALHQSSFRNLQLRFIYRSQMSQITVTHPTVDRDNTLTWNRKFRHETLKDSSESLRIQLTKKPAEGVVAGQAVGQLEEATQKRLLCLGEQRHLDRALSAAQNRAKRDDQEFVEIVKSRVPGSRIIQFLPACHKLFQYRLQRLDSRLQR